MLRIYNIGGQAKGVIVKLFLQMLLALTQEGDIRCCGIEVLLERTLGQLTYGIRKIHLLPVDFAR